MNNFPSCFRRGPALHQMVQGQPCTRWYRARGGKPANRRSRLGLVKTSVVYAHVVNRGSHGVHSPLDRVRKAVSSGGGAIMRSDRAAQNCQERC